MPKKQQRVFTPEFKTQAVQLAMQPETSISQVARDLGISDQTLGTWVRNARQAIALDRPAFPGRGVPALSEQEKRIKELERENAVLRQEREILDLKCDLEDQKAGAGLSTRAYLSGNSFSRAAPNT